MNEIFSGSKNPTTGTTRPLRFLEKFVVGGSPRDQVFAPAQSFPVIAEYFDCELIAFRSRDRDRAFAIVPFDGDFKTYRSFDRSIRDRISFNEIPV